MGTASTPSMSQTANSSVKAVVDSASTRAGLPPSSLGLIEGADKFVGCMLGLLQTVRWKGGLLSRSTTQRDFVIRMQQAACLKGGCEKAAEVRKCGAERLDKFVGPRHSR